MLPHSPTQISRLAIHENHRYRPWFQKIVEFDKEGFFGTKRYARFAQFDPHEPTEVYKLEARRGILLEYGTHIVDMIHALFGCPTSVAGSAYHLNNKVRGESLVHLTFSCGDATVTIDLAWQSSGLGHGGMVLVGDRGEAIYEGTMSRGAESRFRLVRRKDVVLDEHRSPLEDYADSFYRFQSAFVDALSGSAPLPQPAGLNLSVVETTFAAYEAIETGEVIRLHPA